MAETSATEGPLISVTGLEMVYTGARGSHHALTGLDLEVLRGSVVALLGPSACGKTTLLRIVASLIPSLTAGTVTVGGLSPREYRDERGFGFVFQKNVCFPFRSTLGNVLIPWEMRPDLYPAAGPPPETRARDLLRQLGLAGFEESRPSELSGGMRQRVSLARALLLAPELLLADEPLGAVDELNRERLWVDFRRMWTERGVTVLLVTHSVVEAVFLSDLVYVLSPSPGSIVGDGLKVELPTDRKLGLLTTPEFNAICEHVRERLQ